MAQQTISVGAQQSAIFNSLTPPEGPKAVTLPLDFSIAASFLIDCTLAYDRTVLTVVQTLWCDNSANTAETVFVVAGSQQKIIVPAGAQGSFPVITPIRTKITASTTTTALVTVTILNVPLPSAVWTVGPLAIVTPVETLTQPGTAKAGASVTIATGGTSQVAIAAGVITQQGVIKNPNSATESLFVDMVNAAGTTDGASGTTFELKAGDKFIVPPVTGAVNVNAATTGHAFIVTVV